MSMDEISGVAFLVTDRTGNVRVEVTISGVLEIMIPITGTATMPSSEGGG